MKDKKNEGIVIRKASKVPTRKEREIKREYWRKKQQESRKNRHPQKIRRKKENDRVRLRELRLKVKIQKLKKKSPRKKLQLRETLIETLKINHVARRMAAKKFSNAQNSEFLSRYQPIIS